MDEAIEYTGILTKQAERAEQAEPVSTLAEDYFHDVGLYRGPEALNSEARFDKALGDLAKIIAERRITGKTRKGAQVSQNHGPTNWGSPLSLRIKAGKGGIENIGADRETSPYNNWFMTGSKYEAINLKGIPVEVVVNGNSEEEIEERMRAVKEKLGDSVEVLSIQDLLDERFENIAKFFKDGKIKEDFLKNTSEMTLANRKKLAETLTIKVGTLLAQGKHPHLSASERSSHLDSFSAEVIESSAPEAIKEAYNSLNRESPEDAEEFYKNFSQLSYPDQLGVALDLILRPNENPWSIFVSYLPAPDNDTLLREPSV